MLINDIQVSLMFNLGFYGFLNVSQFQVLTEKSAGYIREMLGSLKRLEYISSYRIEISYKVRAENIYFLAPIGVEFLLSNKLALPDDLKFPISKSPVVTKDYLHRQSFITSQIFLTKYLQTHKIAINGFYTYFDKTGSAKERNLKAKTRIELDKGSFYIPDGVLKTNNALYLLEMYCDRDTKRIINQLGQHAQAITLGTPAQAFGLNKVNPMILSVFAHKGIMKAVIKRLLTNEGFATVSPLYFFATLEDVQKDCRTAFTDIHNNALSIN